MRTIHVVTWTPDSVGGFEWRVERSEAQKFADNLDDTNVEVTACEVPDEVGDNPDNITQWLDAEVWSDGPPQRDFSEVYADLVAAQGWNSSSETNLALEYIRNQQQDDAFLDFLREHAEYENAPGPSLGAEYSAVALTEPKWAARLAREAHNSSPED